jgi:proline iminopeptidase
MVWLKVAGLGAVLLVGVGVSLWWWMGRPMFEPGSVASRIAARGESLAPASPQAPDADAWEVAPGVRLHHFAVGQGRDVVVVHGGPALPPREPWRAALVGPPQVRWHFYHQRGCGQSSRPFTAPPPGGTWQAMQAVESALGLSQQLADLERIRHVLGRERLVLVGHSFGALIAALYAAEFPERVAALVLVAPAPLVRMPVEEGDLFSLVRERLPPALQRELDAHLEGAFDFRSLLQRDEAAVARTYADFGRFYARATGAPEPVLRDDLGGFLTLGLYLGLGRRHNWTEWLGRVRAPVLVLHGGGDLQPRAATEAFAAALPGARLVEIEGGGHFPYDSRPEAFAQAVNAFLAQVPE